MADLSFAAQQIMVAATNGNFNVVNDPVYRQCIAAALRTVADQVVPRPPKNWELISCVSARELEIRNQLLAIISELENING